MYRANTQTVNIWLGVTKNSGGSYETADGSGDYHIDWVTPMDLSMSPGQHGVYIDVTDANWRQKTASVSNTYHYACVKQARNFGESGFASLSNT